MLILLVYNLKKISVVLCTLTGPFFYQIFKIYNDFISSKVRKHLVQFSITEMFISKLNCLIGKKAIKCFVEFSITKMFTTHFHSSAKMFMTSSHFDVCYDNESLHTFCTWWPNGSKHELKGHSASNPDFHLGTDPSMIKFVNSLA